MHKTDVEENSNYKNKFVTKTYSKILSQAIVSVDDG